MRVGIFLLKIFCSYKCYKHDTFHSNFLSQSPQESPTMSHYSWHNLHYSNRSFIFFRDSKDRYSERDLEQKDNFLLSPTTKDMITVWKVKLKYLSLVNNIGSKIWQLNLIINTSTKSRQIFVGTRIFDRIILFETFTWVSLNTFSNPFLSVHKFFPLCAIEHKLQMFQGKIHNNGKRCSHLFQTIFETRNWFFKNSFFSCKHRCKAKCY